MNPGVPIWQSRVNNEVRGSGFTTRCAYMAEPVRMKTGERGVPSWRGKAQMGGKWVKKREGSEEKPTQKRQEQGLTSGLD